MLEARRIQSCVVTGPTGAIGVALCELLNRQGVKVHAIVRPGTERSSSLSHINGLHVVECDVSRLNTLPTQVSSADAFFHLAWVKTTGAGRNDMSAQIRNIQFTMDACQVAKELGCTVFVGAGSQAEYGLVDCVLTANTPCFPQNGYGMAKLCAGQMSRVECERLGIDHVWPRILSVYGPHDGRDSMVMSVIYKLIDGEKPSLTRGEQIWDYLYEEDASEALYRLALYGRGGSVYPVGSGTARPLRKYIESIRDTMGSSLDLGFGEIPYGLNQVMYLRADITDLQRDTGFAPRISFDEGIARTISYVRGYEGGT